MYTHACWALTYHQANLPTPAIAKKNHFVGCRRVSRTVSKIQRKFANVDETVRDTVFMIQQITIQMVLTVHISDYILKFN